MFGKPANPKQGQHRLESLCAETWATEIQGCQNNQNFSDDFLEALVVRALKLRAVANAALMVPEERNAGYKELFADMTDSKYVGTIVCLADSSENRQKTWHWIALTPFADKCGSDEIAYIDPMDRTNVQCIRKELQSIKTKLESVHAAAFLTVFDQVGGQETVNVKRVRNHSTTTTTKTIPTFKELVVGGLFRINVNGTQQDVKSIDDVDVRQLISLTGPAVLHVLEHSRMDSIDVLKKIAIVSDGFVPKMQYVQEFPGQALLLAYTYAVLDKNRETEGTPGLDADLMEKYVWVLEHPDPILFETLRAYVGLPDSFTLEDLKDRKKVLGTRKSSQDTKTSTSTSTKTSTTKRQTRKDKTNKDTKAAPSFISEPDEGERKDRKKDNINNSKTGQYDIYNVNDSTVVGEEINKGIFDVVKDPKKVKTTNNLQKELEGLEDSIRLQLREKGYTRKNQSWNYVENTETRRRIDPLLRQRKELRTKLKEQQNKERIEDDTTNIDVVANQMAATSV